MSTTTSHVNTRLGGYTFRDVTSDKGSLELDSIDRGPYQSPSIEILLLILRLSDRSTDRPLLLTVTPCISYLSEIDSVTLSSCHLVVLTYRKLLAISA